MSSNIICGPLDKLCIRLQLTSIGALVFAMGWIGFAWYPAATAESENDTTALAQLGFYSPETHRIRLFGRPPIYKSHFASCQILIARDEGQQWAIIPAKTSGPIDERRERHLVHVSDYLSLYESSVNDPYLQACIKGS